ncbi:hypothetical protein TEA_020279 [Camellia sinensis var. sinensis]|uniref:Uncharacterized protein n=1 Tax=Camellia sinensis var. sinensis TaxID=542762 RepID=A0A4S4EEJ5_CAMSN|nr:hypothetical protein TEA_020279 [Camellia sinensis var. sinensis]
MAYYLMFEQVVSNILLSCCDHDKVHPDARPYKTKAVLNFNDLCLIYGYASADGRYSRSSHDVDVEDDIQGVNLGQVLSIRCFPYGDKELEDDTSGIKAGVFEFSITKGLTISCKVHEKLWSSEDEHPDAIAYKNKTLGYYNDLCILFGSGIADGGLSCQDMGTEIDYNALEIEMDQVSGCIQIPLLDVDTSDRGKKRPTKMPSVSGRSRKVQKTGEEIQEPCTDTTSVVTRLVKKQEKSYDSIANAIDALQSISDIDDELLLDGCDLLEDERKAKTFLALDVNLRKRWLLRKLGR